MHVLEGLVLVDADEPPLVVWSPNPELVLETTLYDPIGLAGSAGFLGPCFWHKPGELSGGPIAHVGLAQLGEGSLLLLPDSGLGSQEVGLEA